MIFEIINIALISAAIRTTTPIFLAGLGGTFTSKSGIFNVSLEGQMLISAFCAVVGTYFTGSSIIGVLCGIVSAIILSLLFALFVVSLRANPIVVGLAINIFASGATISIMKAVFATRGSLISSNIVGLPAIEIPFAWEILGEYSEIISGYTPFVYLSFIFLVIVMIIFYKTKLGLYISVVGEKENAAIAQGINTAKIKYISSIFCGFFCGIAGAHLSLGYMTMFTENMSSGRGFMALAALAFSNAHPLKLFLGCLVFGFSDTLAMRLQGFGIPSYLILAMPYIVTLLFLFLITYKNRPRIIKETLETMQKALAR